jgi:hypothetical protein
MQCQSKLEAQGVKLAGSCCSYVAWNAGLLKMHNCCQAQEFHDWLSKSSRINTMPISESLRLLRPA